MLVDAFLPPARTCPDRSYQCSLVILTNQSMQPLRASQTSLTAIELSNWSNSSDEMKQRTGRGWFR